MSAVRSAGEALLVVVSPAALALDAESVRVARDVLGAAFAVKLVVPGSLAELERTLSRRGGKRLVVIGDDRAVHQVVQVLHQRAELAVSPLGIIPIGNGEKVTLTRSLGVAARPVDAARTVVGGAERTLGLLVDESGGVVLGGLRIPGRGHPGAVPGAAAELIHPDRPPGSADGAAAVPQPSGADSEPRSLRANKAAPGRGGLLPSRCLGWGLQFGRAARSVAAQLRPLRGDPGQALLVEADGRMLADLDHPVYLVAAPDDGLMEVLLSPSSGSGGPLRVRVRRITVSGGPATSFTYLADDAPGGPVQHRTWTAEPAAWRLTVPPAA
ncbi:MULTISPECIES: diacylglycerol kinase family protein [Streptacidiphilus]|uniref:Diacylglycerol kinase family protein n=2 Tax=Streptacidiphilus TaxID=228398 RepID=A0ABV6UTY9_9ACTN|nr:diacylglycerol kinase family protein [Streptacidiphilus jeojiense]